jgi:diguanylate cyclase (GGDEF)-like protein
MQVRYSKTDISLPLAVMSGLVLLSALLATILLVNRFDLAARMREQKLVENAMLDRSNEIASSVLPQVVWDDAVKHLDNKFDLQWARDNLGVYLHHSQGVDFVSVVDRHGSVIYNSIAGADAESPPISSKAPLVRNLLERVRAAEEARGPLPANVYRSGLPAPIKASSIMAVSGKPYVVMALLVEPDFGRSRLREARAPIVLVGVNIDADFLKVLSSRLLLDGLHFNDGRSDKPGEAHSVARDALGRAVVTLDWISARPGRKVLNDIGPVILLIASLLLSAMLLLYRRSHRIATGLVASEARATHLAYHDTLTGLANRAMFVRRLEEGLSRIGRNDGTVTVLCLDLDRFKEINDTYGHLVGDELIRQAAGRLAGQCRAHEVLARLSGDEFAIVQVDASAADAAALARRLCDVMTRPFELSTGRVFISCSIGIARSTDAATEPVELLRQADLGLYRAKQTGRSRYCFFDTEMDMMIGVRRLLEEELRAAIRSGALTMAYQPQVDGQGRLTGVEALIRWCHPQRGEISPAYFIPIAEQCGLIHELGIFTLRQAFVDSHQWVGLRTAINVSANQLQAKDFLSTVLQLVAETGVDPANFDLEITEGVLLRDDPDMHAMLAGLRDAGFGLALDDFGTGYSSLSYLSSYPINKIKIDRSFVANLSRDRASKEVVTAMIRLARALRLSVIAEGVETIEQHAWLSSVGCPDAQGYLFGSAAACEEIRRLWMSSECGGRSRLHHDIPALVA